MTIEDYINTNLRNAILRAYGKDSELSVRFKGLTGRRFTLSFLSFDEIPEVIRVDLPIEGYVVTLVGKLKASDGDEYSYEVFEKAGILQRRSKPRYVSFEPCKVAGFRGVIIDVSENGCQVITEYKPNLREMLRLELTSRGTFETVQVMWYVEEEECYRFGAYIPQPSESWSTVSKTYELLGEKL
ncbi:PilZ domain-containing protein [Fervidobacterium thailandense]|uniref:Pilus assembly protein PilZ n=1 Tax=Fervidobacterium thailandense TaxID=1008305 RepID=A0A1E3G3R9_9BACT|nr:PilZ domain-containing protein [Fervidobacterium thailandense]ODN30907.1 pilus assembly protein PilZ [Fervidobacterium thailandense]